MTIKMLIVDDEPIIIRGLRETIPWDTIGVEVVGEASDGAEALELIDQLPVDLVLTDINMDGMDGLTLSKTLREKYPHIRIIILSGYDDFEYARRAIRIGVEDFLLKPVDIDELMTMVQGIGGKLQQEADRNRQQVHSSWLNWLNRLMRSGGSLPEGDQAPVVPEGIYGFRFLASQLEDYAQWAEKSTEEQRQTVRQNWEQAVQTALSIEGQEIHSFFHHPNLLISLCIGFQEMSPESLFSVLANVPGPAGEENRLLFGVSSSFRALSQAYARCEDAIAAVQLSPVLKERTVLFRGESIPSRRSHSHIATLELENRLLNLLSNGSADELEDELEKLMKESREKGCSLTDIVQKVKELKVAIQRRLRNSSIDVTNEIEGFLSGEIDLLANNSYRAIEVLIRRELFSLYSRIQSSVNDKNHWTIDRVKKYIESHYSTDLKASEVAGWLKITPNYFSIIFNQFFGKGFAEYLNEVRIEHAKAILSGTNDRVFEIAGMVGYNDYKYFCSIFKLYTGFTPTQYRKIAETTHT
jgi:two-component system response regulator YesN